MTSKFATLFLTVCLAIGTTGCAVTTTGESRWEVFCGIKTTQVSKDKEAKVEIKSSVVDKIVGSFVDGEVSEAE